MPKLTVIIPLGRQTSLDPDWLKAMQALPDGSEVIFVSSGHYFRQLEREPVHACLSQCQIKWLCAAESTTAQLNTATATAQGRWLWFLRPDHLLNIKLISEMQTMQLDQFRGVVCARVRYLKSAPLQFRLLNPLINLLSRAIKLPLPEQGYCVSKSMLASLGGFPPGSDDSDLCLLLSICQLQLPVQMTTATLSSSGRTGRLLPWLGLCLHALKLHIQHQLCNCNRRQQNS
ncbi:hypothetical protein ACFVYJ_06035 [Pontibacter sp. JAM-7]